MPSRHSKNAGDRGFHTHKETHTNDFGTQRARLSTDSQLPFGYCPLSLIPIKEAVLSPSGRLYDREAILDYLLQKTQEIKKHQIAYEKQQQLYAKEQEAHTREEEEKAIKSFADNQDGVAPVVGNKRGIEKAVSQRELEYLGNVKKTDRSRAIDETDKETALVELSKVSPWVAAFTPSAKATALQPPPRRPQSPFSGQPLRTKDLIPLDLKRDDSSAGLGTAGSIKFVCPVSLKTITNQKVVVLKNTGTMMLESVAKDLAFKTMTCPITGKKFKESDVIHLAQAASGFSASGAVEASKYRPNNH